MIEVTLPYGIKTIDDEAFSCCSSLQKVYLPASVQRIGERAFYRCQNLEEINIPEGIKSIGDLAFYYCSDLKEITLPKSENYIGDEAFRRIILQHSHSESREIEKPITFYVYRNSYADNYVKTYHSYDKLKYRK